MTVLTSARRRISACSAGCLLKPRAQYFASAYRDAEHLSEKNVFLGFSTEEKRRY
jgi:hypothetical protein